MHQGKLFVTGAGINLMMVAPTEPYIVNFGLGITVEIPWTATNQNHRLRLALVDEDEHVVPVTRPLPGVQVSKEDEGVILGNFNAGRSPSMQVSEDSILPLAFQFPNLQLPRPGNYKITMQIDGTAVASVRFRVAAPAMTVPGTATPGGPASLPPV